MSKIIYPAQCSCGHFFLEKHELSTEASKEYAGFCWCGFCRKKLMIKRVKAVKETK